MLKIKEKNLMIRIFIYLYFFSIGINPLITAFIPINNIHYVFFVVILGLLGINIFKENVFKINRICVSALLYIGFVLLNVFLYNSDMEFIIRSISFRIFFPILFLPLFMWFNTKEERTKLLFGIIKCVFAISIINAIAGIIELINPQIIHSLYGENLTSHLSLIINGKITPRILSLSNNPINLGFYMTLGIVSSLILGTRYLKSKKIKAIIIYSAIPLFIYIILHTYSRAALVVAIIAIISFSISIGVRKLKSDKKIIYNVNKKKKMIMAVIILATIVLCGKLVVSSESMFTRINTINLDTYLENARFKRVIEAFEKETDFVDIILGHGIILENNSGAYVFELGYGSMLYEIGIIATGTFIFLTFNALYRKSNYEIEDSSDIDYLVCQFCKIVIIAGLVAMFVEDVYMQMPYNIFIWLAIVYLITKPKVENTHKKKMMFFTAGLTSGGSERVISILSNNLVQENEISLLVYSDKNKAYEFDKRINIFQTDKKVFKRSITVLINRIINAYKYIKKERPDVIITFLPYPSYIALLIKKIIKVKVIVCDRNDPKMEYSKRRSALLMNWLYPKADGFVFQTKEQQEYFSENIVKKSIIIYNPINPKFVNKGLNIKKEKTIITVGRLHCQKNHMLLIDAFIQINKKYPMYKLKIYGEGELKGELQEYIKNKKMQKNVILCGTTNNIQLELQKAEIFVLSSDYEGMPNSLIEAMACGVPVVATDCPCGGPKELITNRENGLLTKVKDMEELIEAIELLINNRELANKLGENSRKITDVLDLNKILLRWKKYISEVTEEK